jgi:5-methylcytosine-specific restriction endonuclease McrA
VSRTPRKNQWNRAAAKCDGRCWYCGVKPDPDDLTVDHATPRSRGGKNRDENLLPACEYCNNLKDCLTLSEFRKFVKVRISRNLTALGHCNSSVRVVFWGEGNDSPFAY